MPHEQREMRFVSPVDLAIEAAATDDKPTLVRVDAYSGGLMTVAGFGPVVLDVEGIQSPERVPLLADHENRIEAVLGSGIPVRRDGRLAVEGTLSRASERAMRVIELHREGVPLQASVGAEPLETERIAKGRQVVVNGRAIRAEASSFLLVRRSRLKHVAIVANGADGDTSVNIAAQAAPLKEKSDMEFSQWIEAQGFVAADLDDKQTASLQAMYDAANKPPGTDASATAGKDVTASAVADLRAELAAETARVAAIRTICAGKHSDIEAKAIGEGWDATKTELAVIRAERPKAPAIHAAGDYGLAESEVIEAALWIARKHSDVEKRFKPEVLDAADRQYRNLGFQQLFMMAAAANGYPSRPGESIHSGNIREVLSYAFPPRSLQASHSTFSLPGILQNLANKELLVGYTEEDQTWREVATVKSVSDFKEVTSYRLLDDMEYEELPKHGEIKHGKVSEESYTRQVRTYAKMYGLDRTDIINDDLSALDDLRTRVGAGAAKKLNNVFWAKFLDNAGFFTAARGNYITGADTALGIDGTGLQKGITAFRKLRSPAADGKKRVVGGRPEFLLVPPELEFVAQRLYQSTTVNSGGAATAESIPDANIHAGKYRPVVCDWLSDPDFAGSSATAWYLFRSPRNLAAVVVSFLDGNQNPTVDVAEADFNQLGVQFRGYHDFGVDFAEYLAGIKSKGAA
jgi:phage major head subunit gpT-like protein